MTHERKITKIKYSNNTSSIKALSIMFAEHLYFKNVEFTIRGFENPNIIIFDIPVHGFIVSIFSDSAYIKNISLSKEDVISIENFLRFYLEMETGCFSEYSTFSEFLKNFSLGDPFSRLTFEGFSKKCLYE